MCTSLSFNHHPTRIPGINIVIKPALTLPSSAGFCKWLAKSLPASLVLRTTNPLSHQTIVATALPIITDYFHSAARYTWIGSAYLLSMAAASPIWGKVSDIWGRKPILLSAVAVFFTGSLICGVASSMAMLIAGRAVQGSAAGGVVILVNICVSDLFSMRWVVRSFSYLLNLLPTVS